MQLCETDSGDMEIGLGSVVTSLFHRSHGLPANNKSSNSKDYGFRRLICVCGKRTGAVNLYDNEANRLIETLLVAHKLKCAGKRKKGAYAR